MPVAGHPGCNECKLCSGTQTWMPPLGFNFRAKYLFVAEQFHPSHRKQLIAKLNELEFDTSDVEVAYLTKCFAGQGNKAQVKEAQKCYPLFEQFLGMVSKDTIIIPMGAIPCKLVARQKSILTAHGAVFDVDGRVVIPTISVAQVVAYPDSLKTFTGDLEKIEARGRGEVKTKATVYHKLVDTIGKFKKMIVSLWHSPKYAFDIESTSLNPFRSKPFAAAVLMIAFSNAPGSGWALPLDHKDAPWTQEQRKYIVKQLRTLMEAKHNGKIAHNGQFDILYLRKVLNIRVQCFDFDTLLAHSVAVTEQKGTHGLKILAWEFTDMGGYDDPLDEYKAQHPEADPDKGGHYGMIPLDILWTYAVCDVDVTFRLYEQFAPIIDAEFKWLFENITMPATNALAAVQYNGAPIDWKWYEHCAEVYPKLLEEQHQAIREFPEVIQVERELTQAIRRKKQQERLNRFKKRYEEVDELQKTDPEKADKKLRRLLSDIARAKTKPVAVVPVIFNPKSPAHKSKLIFEVLQFESKKRTKANAKSTDKEEMKRFWFDTKHPLIMAIGKWGKISTLYTMFVKTLPELIGDDGRLRGSYNVAGTETGRLSMSSPNLQQIPRNLKNDPKEPFVDATAWPSIKKLFAVQDDDYVVFQFDYSQAELRVLAALARDPVLMSAYMNGEDVHRRVASEAFGVPLDEVTDYQRNVAKTINFGLLYGQGAAKLAKTIGCTVEEAKEFIRIYFEKLPGVRKFIKKTKSFVRENGFVKSPYGRKRRLESVFSPEQDIVAKAERQGVNSPIQATASDWTLMSLARINRWLEANEMRSQIILTVHDSIILLVHKEEINRVFKMVKKIMQNPSDPTGWIGKTPVVADGSLGLNWGKLKDVKDVEEIPAALDEIYAKAA